MKTFKNIVLIIIVLICNTFPAVSQTIPNYARLDSLMQLLSENKKFMGTVAITQNNKLEYSKAFGYADMGNNIAAGADTRYRIGSISKMFTSVMIFQLTEEKKLNLNTLLSEFYPEIPYATEITINDMLTHRSGIWSVTNDSLYLEWCTEPESHQAIINRIVNHKIEFRPREKSEYSNSNFILLGYIIEKGTGKDYAQNLKERISDKIGLKSTYYGKMADIGANESYSYSIQDGNWIIEKETDMSIPHGAGAVVSTSEDLTTFAIALFDEKLISRKNLDEMIKTEGTYGKGIFPMPFFELMGFGHTGGIDGFRSVLIHFPEKYLSLAVCANALNYDQNELLIGILSIVTGKPYALPSFVSMKLDPEHLRKFEGVYAKEGFPLKLTIKLDGETLTAQGTGQPAFPLEAVSETEFTFVAGGIKISFPADNQLNIKQGGMDILMTKE